MKLLENLSVLEELIKTNVAPIMTSLINSDNIAEAAIIDARVSIDELNGVYEGSKYTFPLWYKDFNVNNKRIIIIKNLDCIEKKEQLKFKELLKNRKVGNMVIPKNIPIIVTLKNKDAIINETIFTLTLHVGE